MGITITDIAEKAGVSKTTVSFAFNNPERIAPSTLERIMTIARETGYSPDPIARILSNKKTRAVGIVLQKSFPDLFQDPSLGELLRGIGLICNQHGFTLSIVTPANGLVSQAVLNAAVDGMICVGSTTRCDAQTAFKQRKIPCVTIDAAETTEFINVGINDEKIAEELMDLLIKNGHRSICVCSLEPASADGQILNPPAMQEARMRGIRSSAKKHSIPLNSQRVRWSYIPAAPDGAYEAALSLLKSKTRPTAIFCMADIQAFGFYRAARELSLSIPHDLSIVSFDDLPISATLSPGLTTVHQSAFDKGRVAAESLFKGITGEQCSSQIIDANIVHRESVGRVRT